VATNFQHGSRERIGPSLCSTRPLDRKFARYGVVVGRRGAARTNYTNDATVVFRSKISNFLIFGERLKIFLIHETYSTALEILVELNLNLIVFSRQSCPDFSPIFERLTGHEFSKRESQANTPVTRKMTPQGGPSLRKSCVVRPVLREIVEFNDERSKSLNETLRVTGRTTQRIRRLFNILVGYHSN